MKKLLLLSVFCAAFIMANAQINDTYAPDFTFYEINKTTGDIITSNPYTLHQYLDSGKVVFIDVFATWCSPCWNFHQTGAFESLYNQYGPNGTNEVMVFGVEGDAGNFSALTGGADAGGYASQGNWLNGVEYPVIPTHMAPNNTSTFLSDYSIAYFPTLYMICPSGFVYEIESNNGYSYYNASQIFSNIASKCPNFDTEAEANAAVAPAVKGFKDNYICHVTESPVVLLENVAENTLTSVEFSIDLDGVVSTYTWTGSLEKFQWAEVELPEIQTDVHGNHTYTVTIVKANGINDPDPLKGVATGTFKVQATPSTSNINATFNSIPNTWAQENGYLNIYQGKMYFNAWALPAGATETLSLPPLDLTRYTHPFLKFDLAHKRYGSKIENLKVESATNCQDTWTVLYDVSDPELSSGVSNSQFIPSSGDWRTQKIDLSGISDLSNVELRFVFTSGNGNIIWIDNLKIYEGVGVDDIEMETLAVYPNPTTGMLYVNASEPVREVQIFNLQGQLVLSQKGDVREISMFDLSDGLYMVKVFTVDGAVSTQKIVKQ